MIWPPFSEVQVFISFTSFLLFIITHAGLAWEFYVLSDIRIQIIVPMFLVLTTWKLFRIIRSQQPATPEDKYWLVMFFYAVLGIFSFMSLQLNGVQRPQSWWEYVNYLLVQYTAILSLITFFATVMVYRAKRSDWLYGHMTADQTPTIIFLLAFVCCLLGLVVLSPYYRGDAVLVLTYFYISQFITMVERIGRSFGLLK